MRPKHIFLKGWFKKKKDSGLQCEIHKLSEWRLCMQGPGQILVAGFIYYFYNGFLTDIPRDRHQTVPIEQD